MQLLALITHKHPFSPAQRPGEVNHDSNHLSRNQENIRIEGSYRYFKTPWNICCINSLIYCRSLISDVFLSSRNIFNILRQSSIVGIMAIGMTFVLIGGDIDLSVGSTLSLCMVLAIGLQQQGLALSILIVLIVGILAGLLNGLLVGLFKANAFIVTLGTMSIIQAIALIYSKGYHMLGDPESAFSIIGRGMIGPVPIPVIIFVTFGIIFHIILSNSKFGYSVYATGGNAKQLGHQVFILV